MDTILSRIHRAQISSMIIASGCIKVAYIAELRQKTRELPVRQRNERTFQ